MVRRDRIGNKQKGQEAHPQDNVIGPTRTNNGCLQIGPSNSRILDPIENVNIGVGEQCSPQNAQGKIRENEELRLGEAVVGVGRMDETMLDTEQRCGVAGHTDN